jgi:mannitol/fructose-specific phosphotransferase system IIA component
LKDILQECKKQNELLKDMLQECKKQNRVVEKYVPGMQETEPGC